MAAGDTSLAALSLEAVEGLPGLRRRRGRRTSAASRRPTPRTVRIELDHARCRCCPSVLSSPMLSVVDADDDRRATWPTSTSAARGRWRRPTTATCVLERRDGAPASLAARRAAAAYDDEEAAYDGLRGRRRRLGRRCRPSRYEEAVEDVRRRRLRAVPGRAVLRDEPQQPEPRQRRRCGRPSSWPSTGTPSSRRCTPTWPIRSPRSSPPASSGHDPDRCPACAYDPDAGGRHRRLRRTRTATCRPSASTSTSRRPSRRWPSWSPTTSRPSASPPSSGRCRSRSTRTFVVSGDQELFSFGWIGAYRSPDAYLAPLFGSAANDNLTNYRSRQVDGLLARARRRAPTPSRERRSAGPAPRPTILAGRGRRARSPSSAPRSWSPTGSRASRTAVDGTVDWTQVEPRRLTRDRLAAPAGAVYGDHSPGVTRGATSEWRNWQTRQLEGLVSSRTWGFKSPLRHDRSRRSASPISRRLLHQ